MRIRGYFSKPKGAREQKSLGNTALEHDFPLVCCGDVSEGATIERCQLWFVPACRALVLTWCSSVAGGLWGRRYLEQTVRGAAVTNFAITPHSFVLLTFDWAGVGLGLLVLFRCHGDRNDIFMVYAGVSGRFRLVLEVGSTFPHRIFYAKCFGFFGT